MASLKVKLRSSTVAGRAGTIYYQITHRQTSRQITTGIRIRPEAWDAVEARIRPEADHAAALQTVIEEELCRLRRIIRSLDRSGQSYTAVDVVQQYRLADRSVGFLTFMRRQIDRKYAEKRLGTACNYTRALNSFSQYLRGVDVPFSLFTEQLVEGYNAYLLRRGIVRNSVSFYMRILRAVYNRAVRQHLIVSDEPFRHVYTGIDRTCKRAVDERLLVRLGRLVLPPYSPMSIARDLFIFSYCTRGMAFVDIAYLRKTDIRDGTIRYARRKTGQQLCIRIEPGIRTIIERYEPLTRDSGYVFPLLTVDEEQAAFRQYRAALNNYNRLLGNLSELLGVQSRITSYTSRHSWATAARNHDIPVSVISAGLGHTSERTTQIYLAALENSVIDTANRKIISQLEAAGIAGE